MEFNEQNKLMNKIEPEARIYGTAWEVKRKKETLAGVAQLLGALSCKPKVEGLVPSRDTYRKQLIDILSH